MNFRGVLPALITPLTGAGAVNEPVLERLLERLYRAEVHGVYVCGNTGEGMRMSVQARKTVAAAAVRCSPPGKTVIAHVGSATVEDAVALAEHAAKCGVHAISSLPPCADFEAIKRYYREVAAATGLPLLIYFFPEAAPALQSLGQLEELCALPNVAGLKFTDFDLYRLSLLSRRGLVLFNGRDEVFAAGLLMGAAGGIGSFYNVIPEAFVRAYQAASDGRYDLARREQDAINDLICATLRFPLVPALKQMLQWSGFDCGPSLAARPLTAQEVSSLRSSTARLLPGATG